MGEQYCQNYYWLNVQIPLDWVLNKPCDCLEMQACLVRSDRALTIYLHTLCDNQQFKLHTCLCHTQNQE